MVYLHIKSDIFVLIKNVLNYIIFKFLSIDFCKFQVFEIIYLSMN